MVRSDDLKGPSSAVAASDNMVLWVWCTAGSRSTSESSLLAKTHPGLDDGDDDDDDDDSW